MYEEYVSLLSPETLYYNLIYHLRQEGLSEEDKEKIIHEIIRRNIVVKECTKE